MPKVTVKTGTTQDGEYELDLEHFTWRERAYITEVSGTLPPDYLAKWFAADPKTVLATVAVMMQRAGRRPDLDVLLDADDRDSIVVDYTDLQSGEGDDGPPSRSPSESGAPGDSDDSTATSGPGSSSSSAGPGTRRKERGRRGSANAATSAPPTSAT